MSELLKYTLRIADNALILAQRMAEWCSRGPTLEEDIAMSNIALDLFGQANGFFEYAARLDGKRTADDFAFQRDASEFFNHKITEQENGDFGNTMIRNLLNDTYYFLFYQKLAKSKDKTLSAIAEKSFKEIKYHLRHSRNWVIRLGDGTRESNERVQKSLNNYWKFTGEFFEMDNIDIKMEKKGIGVHNNHLKKDWDDLINQTLQEAKLVRPKDCKMVTGSKEGQHTEHLNILLSDMQHLPRKYPNAKW